VGLADVEIVNHEVQVRLLGNGALGPRGGHVVSDPLERDDRTLRGHHLQPRDVLGGEVAQRLDLTSGEASVEVSERDGIGAVEREDL
jgi:hypothetical protein